MLLLQLKLHEKRVISLLSDILLIKLKQLKVLDNSSYMHGKKLIQLILFV